MLQEGILFFFGILLKKSLCLGDHLQANPEAEVGSSFRTGPVYRSSLYSIMGSQQSKKSRHLPHFLAAGLPCDSPEHRAMASDYPTYKLDQNSVADHSISWERYNPSNSNGASTAGREGEVITNVAIGTNNRLV